MVYQNAVRQFNCPFHIKEKASQVMDAPPQHNAAPLGSIEPHAYLLNAPADGQLLYKIMSVENLLRSIAGNFLHFNRVDSYVDFPRADLDDGRQLPKDQQTNVRIPFENAPEFSAAHYYDQSRARTYACCFSLENSDFIWENYENSSTKGKVCVVFDFGRLRATLNRTLQPGSAALEHSGIRCHQIFSLNYGIVDYVEWNTHQTNTEYLVNPIKYTYLKDKKKFSEEREFRISLSAFGMGKFALRDGSIMEFSPSMQVMFDFSAAIADTTIFQILCTQDLDSDLLPSDQPNFRLVARKN